MNRTPSSLPNSDFAMLLFLGCASSILMAFACALYVLMSPKILNEAAITPYKRPQATMLLSPKMAVERLEIERIAVEAAKVMNAEMKMASVTDPVPAKRADARPKAKRVAARTRVVTRAPSAGGRDFTSQPPYAAFARQEFASYW
jgi:hypothetical protein